MVMEASPSPDSVGREFVRQYYTLLNKAPTHLHRFYNNQSSFIHGGLRTSSTNHHPSIGQKQIHQKIQQLNFRDCHAKIAQVDAQATLGNGVVVQVTGELSNAGQPMRRFTQTFVLAAQSPKKYYVHNDIFRYQDEICEDDEGGEETGGVGVDEGVGEEAVVEQQQQQRGVEQHDAQQQMVNVLSQHTQPPSQAHGHAAIQQLYAQQQQSVASGANVMPAVINGGVHPDDLQQAVVAAATASMPPANVLDEEPTVEDVALNESGTGYVEQQGAGGDVDHHHIHHHQDNIESNIAAMSNEPKTYATLVKSGGGGGGFNATQQMQQPPLPKPTSPPPQQQRYDTRDLSASLGGALGNPNVGMLNQQQRNRERGDSNRNTNRPNQSTLGQQQRLPRQDTSRGGSRNNIGGNDDGNTYEERRRSQPATERPNMGTFNSDRDRDSNQLFLGNLPHSATEEDLREVFIRFGNILDLRIYSKGNMNKNQAPTNAPPGGNVRAPPNYGFITYETQAAVQQCLASKPIMLQTSDKSQPVQLNVEEKKVKEKTTSYAGANSSNTGGSNRIAFDGGNIRGGDVVRQQRDGPRRLTGSGSGSNQQARMSMDNSGRNNRANNFASNRNSGGSGSGPQNRGGNTTYNNRR